MNKISIPVRVSRETLAEIDKLAAATGKTRAEIMRDALRAYAAAAAVNPGPPGEFLARMMAAAPLPSRPPIRERMAAMS